MMASIGDSGEQNELAIVLAAVEKYQGEIDEDLEVREGIRTVVRDIERVTKRIYFVIFSIHSDPREANLTLTGTKVKDILTTAVHPLITTLKSRIPDGEYYKYNDHFKHTFQKLAYMGILSNYLLQGSISGITDTASAIGLKSVDNRGSESIMLDYDDYLVGLLDLASEFSRFCRNCVTFGGNIQRVYNIHESMNQLNAGMHSITFKNDYLRRRYDGLKYNIKSVEEVIYDLKIRGMNEETARESLPIPDVADKEDTGKPEGKTDSPDAT